MCDLVGGSFHLVSKIGEGSFGKVFSAINIDNNQPVAVKIEDSTAKIPQLYFESYIYKLMSGSTNVPNMYHHSSNCNQNVLVIDLLGKSLEDLLEANEYHLDLKTVLMLADQMISAIEFFHHKNYIHRDIKPDNFVMGKGQDSNKLFIIDFGLAKKYRDQITLQHIKYSDGKSLTGTARYASINALRGVEQTRRDDMESLGYVLVYLLKGSLPWMGIKGNKKQKYRKILEKKIDTPITELCKDLPDEFAVYIEKVRGLEFDETPNYAEYRELFRNLFIKKKFVYDYHYAWTTTPFNAANINTPQKTAKKSTHKKRGRRNSDRKLCKASDIGARAKKLEDERNKIDNIVIKNGEKGNKMTKSKTFPLLPKVDPEGEKAPSSKKSKKSGKKSLKGKNKRVRRCLSNHAIKKVDVDAIRKDSLLINDGVFEKVEPVEKAIDEKIPAKGSCAVPPRRRSRKRRNTTFV